MNKYLIQDITYAANGVTRYVREHSVLAKNIEHALEIYTQVCEALGIVPGSLIITLPKK